MNNSIYIYSVALRVRRNCSDRVPGDEILVDNLVKYKAYMLQSGYNSGIVDKHFIKVAKLKRKAVLEGKLPSMRKLESTRSSKINFVTSWDPMFRDMNKALRKFHHILEDDEQCKQLFPRGTFREAYNSPQYKNLVATFTPKLHIFPHKRYWSIVYRQESMYHGLIYILAVNNNSQITH